MLSSCRCILSVGADGVVEAREMKRHMLLGADGGVGAREMNSVSGYSMVGN